MSTTRSALASIRLTYEFCVEGILLARQGDTARSLQLFNDALALTPTSSAAHLCLGLRLFAAGQARDALHHFDQGLELAATAFCRSRILRSRALLHHSTRNYADAIADFDAALDLDPDFADAHYLRGLVAYDLRQYDDCIGHMTRAIRLSNAETAAAAYMNRGNAHTELGRYGAAIRDLTEAAALDPDTSVIYYNRANVYCLTRDLHLALADYTRSIDLDPFHASAYFNRGNTYHELGQYQLAIADFTRAIGLDPSDAARFLESRGCSHCRLGQLDAAYNDFTSAARLRPDTGTVYLNRSTVLFRLERFGEAIQDLTRCLDLNPSCAMAYTKRADIHVRFHRYGRALADYTAALSIAPNDTYVRYMQARCHLDLGQHRRAIDGFTAVLELEPGLTRALLDRAAANAALGGLTHHARAVDDYTRALDLDPSTSGPGAYLGRARSEYALYQHCRAISDCDRALDLNPDLVEAVILRSRAFVEIGAAHHALQTLNLALDHRPTSAVLVAARAHVYMALGRPDLARNEYGRVVALAPESAGAVVADVGDLDQDTVYAGKPTTTTTTTTATTNQVDLIDWHLLRARRQAGALATRDVLARAQVGLRLGQYQAVLSAIEAALEAETEVEVRDHLVEARSMIQYRQSSKARQILGLDGLGGVPGGTPTSTPTSTSRTFWVRGMRPRSGPVVFEPKFGSGTRRVLAQLQWRSALRRSVSSLLARTRSGRPNL